MTVVIIFGTQIVREAFRHPNYHLNILPACQLISSLLINRIFCVYGSLVVYGNLAFAGRERSLSVIGIDLCTRVQALTTPF
jgi:isoprenylcysteine carboxyl methyltransferase (ICMT) family protein YpbQ